MDIGLLLKLQNKVKDLEREKKQLREKIESLEEDTSRGAIISDSAFDALKVGHWLCGGLISFVHLTENSCSFSVQFFKM